MFRKTWTTLPAVLLVLSLHAYPCTRWGPVSNVEMVKEADVIVRAIAEGYDVEPDPNLMPTGVPQTPCCGPFSAPEDPIKRPQRANRNHPRLGSHSKVRFVVLEVIRGKTLSNLTLPGYLSDEDDFNDRPSPYSFVRPGGRHGNCVANAYRSGAQFLRLLKKEKSGGFAMNWYPLGPVNEQLHSTNDPWLLWIRAEAQKVRKQNP